MNLGSEDVNVFQILVFEILLRLPVQSLLRFRCVCKEWCTLIDGSHFKDTYLALRRAMAVDDQFVGIKTWLVSDIPYEDMDRVLSCVDHNDEQVRMLQNDLGRGIYSISVTRWFGDYQSLVQSALASSSSCNDLEISGNYSGVIMIMNHVHGLVCIIHGNNWFDITLVNPALREIRKLPIPVFDLGGFEPSALGIGFGYDDSSNDYKVVAIVTVFEEEGGGGCNSPHKHIGIVYRLSTNSWTILGDMSRFVSSPFVYFPYQDSVFSHGSLHWCMQLRNDDEPQIKYRVLAFDVTDEIFREILFPHGYRYYTPYEHDATVPHLFTFDKSTIALVASTLLTWGEQVLEVWVMKEYGTIGDTTDSWTKLYSISNLPSFVEAICFWKKDSLLIAAVNGDLICYDLLKGQPDEHEQCHPISISGIEGLQLVTGHQSFVSVKLQA